MLKQAMVIKITEDYAIIATDGTEFLKIKRKPGMLVGQKIYISESDIIHDKSPAGKTRTHTFRYLSALAASILFAVIVLNPFGKDVSKAYAVVSLDVNPSFEFRVDKDLKVIEAKSVGEDGRKMVSDSLKGKSLSDAVKDLLVEVDDSGVKIDKDSAILVSSVTLDGTKDENIRKKVFSGIRDAFDERHDYDDSKVVFVDAMEKDIEVAKDKNLSLGRYKLYEMGDGSIDEYEIGEGSIGDIVRMPEIEEDLKGEGDFIIDADDMDEIYEDMLDHPDMDMDDIVDDYYEDDMDDETGNEDDDINQQDMDEMMDEDMDEIDDDSFEESDYDSFEDDDYDENIREDMDSENYDEDDYEDGISESREYRGSQLEEDSAEDGYQESDMEKMDDFDEEIGTDENTEMAEPDAFDEEIDDMEDAVEDNDEMIEDEIDPGEEALDEEEHGFQDDEEMTETSEEYDYDMEDGAETESYDDSDMESDDGDDYDSDDDSYDEEYE